MLNKNGIEKELDNNIYVDRAFRNLKDNYILVTLRNKLKVYDSDFIDIKKPSKTKELIIPKEGLVLEPGKLYLGSTNEYTKTLEYVPVLSGLDDIAIMGMEIHITAGFGDNGFEGTWTLEIVCSNKTKIYPNMPIGKLYYHPIVGDSSILYKGKYLGQIDPTESRISNEYVKKLVRGKNDAY